jgi:hypothetical protein
MYITYHEEISIGDKEVIDFPHGCLDITIKVYLENKGISQANYKVRSNGYYLFIYLDNGDRVDVKIL